MTNIQNINTHTLLLFHSPYMIAFPSQEILFTKKGPNPILLTRIQYFWDGSGHVYGLLGPDVHFAFYLQVHTKWAGPKWDKLN